MIEKEIQLMAIFIGAYLVFALAGDTCLGDSVGVAVELSSENLYLVYFKDRNEETLAFSVFASVYCSHCFS